MQDYARKSRYQDRTIARSYFKERFSRAEGRREDEATKVALEQALASIPQAKVILDMPCGTGRFTGYLRERGYRYVGADVSMEMLEVLVGEGDPESRLSLVRCDGEYLPFKDNAFDSVACIRFLNLLPPVVRHRILKEMRRVSRRWLIVQSHRLKSMGPIMVLKLLVRRWLGVDISKYQLQKEILQGGWRERRRVKIRGTRHCIGVYEKE